MPLMTNFRLLLVYLRLGRLAKIEISQLRLARRLKNSKKIGRHLWTALNNTMWASKAEKGSEFIAAHWPGPSSQQQMAENNGLFNC